jgi:rhodanese-related sulfurtransferase
MANPLLTNVKAVLNALIDPPRELWKRAINLTRGVKDINVHEAQALIHRGVFVLDVREPHEYDAGHVAGAKLIPLGSLLDRVGELKPLQEQYLVIICRGGKRSATACWQLAQVGFSKTYNVAGGIIAWQRAKLAVVR